MRTNIPSLILTGALLVGCNGEIHSKLWTPDALREAMSGKDGIKGVIGYFPRSLIETDEFTQVVDKDGKFVTSDCNRVAIQKVTAVADEVHPIQTWYEPGLLEANQFGVQWAAGIYTAVNSQSSPDQGKTLANLSSAAANFAKLGAAAAPPFIQTTPIVPGKPNCNGVPTLKGFSSLAFPNSAAP
jgi:hypothetical protein